MGAGRTTRLLQAYWPGTFQGTIRAQGTYTDVDVTTLTVDAAAGDTSLTVTSTTGISVGDYLLLGSDRAYMDATLIHDNVRYRGEIVRVKTVTDGTHLALYGFVQDNYAVTNAASLKGITYLDGVGMSNLTIENTDQGNHNSDFVYLLACRNFRFENLWLSYGDNVGIHLDHCRDGVVAHSVFKDFTDDSANSRFGYGILLNRATENVTVDACQFDRLRHSVTTNGSDNKRGVPRNCTISGCAAIHMTNAAFDTHNQGANIIFSGCVATNCDDVGFQIRSADSKVLGCSASYVNTGAIIGQMGHACEIRGSTFRHIVRKAGAGGYGIQVSPNVLRTVIDGNTVDGCDRNLVLIQDGANDAVVQRNRLRNPGADGTSQSGIKCDTGATLTGLVIVDNDLDAVGSSVEGRSSGTLNHVIDLTTTTTASTVQLNRARGFAGNLVNNPGGSGNTISDNNPNSSREKINAVGQGVKSQNFDRAMAANTSLLVTNGTSATLYYSLIPVQAGDLITNIYFGISALATGMVLGKVGLCTTAGVNLAVSSNQGTGWQSGTGTAGIQKVAVTTPYAVQADGVIYVQILCVAGNGTGITVYRQNSQGTVNNQINSAARPYAALATQTDITGTQAPSGAGALSIWVGWD